MEEKKIRKFRKKRKILSYLYILDQPLKINPFVFSRMFFLWMLLGIIGGVMAALYMIALEGIIHAFAGFTGLWVIGIMAISGLAAGLIIHFIGDPGEISLIVNNIRFKNGKLNPKNNPSMILSSLLCVGAGGSLGPEAPLVQVTGSTGTWLGKQFRLKGEEMRSVSIAGMASGFTALFGAPLGGSLFSLEILHHRHVARHYEAIIPAFVASCFSYAVFALIVHLGIGPIWQLPTYEANSLFDFGKAVLYAFAGTFFGWVFIYITKLLKGCFDKLKSPVYIKTFIGGILLGIIAFYLPITRYFGHHEINTLLTSEYTLLFLSAILLFKILAISITVTSGWRGGFIIPLFFVGATVGLIIHQFFPAVNVSLAVISCMAAINACVTRTPLSTIILLSTLTGFDYFIPVMFASLIGYFFAPRIPFISAQMDSKNEKLA